MTTAGGGSPHTTGAGARGAAGAALPEGRLAATGSATGSATAEPVAGSSVEGAACGPMCSMTGGAAGPSGADSATASSELVFFRNCGLGARLFRDRGLRPCSWATRAKNHCLQMKRRGIIIRVVGPHGCARIVRALMDPNDGAHVNLRV